MTSNDLNTDLVLNTLTDDILKELESVGQLQPNQLWLTPDTSSDNELLTLVASLQYTVNNLSEDTETILTRLNMIWCNGHFINKKHI